MDDDVLELQSQPQQPPTEDTVGTEARAHVASTHESRAADDQHQQPNCDMNEEQQTRTSGGGGGLLGSYAPLLLSRSSSAGSKPQNTVSMALPHGSIFSHATTTHSSNSNQPGSSSNGRANGSSELVHQLQRLCSRQRLRSEERHFVRDVERVLALLRQQAHTANIHAQRNRANSFATTSTSSSSTTTSAAACEDQGNGTIAPDANPSRRSHSTSMSQSTGTSSTAQTQHYHHHPSTGSLTLAEIELLFDCIAYLFNHRNYEVRAIAFETITLCMSHYGDQLSNQLRRKIFQQLDEHQAGDFLLRQKALRALTQDGRNLEPFNVELGWLLLRLLEESDEQRDLLGLIQSIMRRSPLALDFETVIAITNVVCSRCDFAWSRGDVESCKKFLSFFHILATHSLELAASTSVSLRTLCCMVNADGHGTWSIMKHLLNGTAGYQVLRGLINLLENPFTSNQWVLRGAVFFLGMSCWGSQRVGKLEDVKWAPILLAMESVLKCNNGVVIFEVILALQRLIKKFGAVKTELDVKQSGSSGAGVLGGARDSVEKKIIVEWDIILHMFRELRPWLSLTEDVDSDDSEGYSSVPSMMTHPQIHNGQQASTFTALEQQQQQFSVSIHQTRIPRELLDTLSFVEDLVAQGKFAGEVGDFFDVLEDYLPHLNEGATLFLLRHRAELAHPAYHVNWLQHLGDAMMTFYSNVSMLGAVRLEALEVLRVNLWVSRNVCEDRVIEDVLLPTLSHVYDDHHPDVRRRGLDFVTEVARLLESVKFDALLDILANAATLSLYEDSQVFAASGIVSLFSSYFNHMPHTRTLRMYEIITKLVETHRNWEVRKIALSCLLHVCEADSDFRLQWKDAQVRTSRFLFCARRAVRNPQTGACVPVARGLRAMLTLVSTETHAELFRMAVSGIRVMLENRVILTDVDISDMALKIISSIDYRAFGRAAIPDELARITDELKDESSGDTQASTAAAANAESASSRNGRKDAWELLSRRNTDSDMLRFMNSTTSSLQRRHGGEAGMFKSSLRDTLVVLCKTKFMTMGLELLTLITSYVSELNGNARRHLITCLVGALGMQLVVADKDIFARPTDLLPAKPCSAINFGGEQQRTPQYETGGFSSAGKTQVDVSYAHHHTMNHLDSESSYRLPSHSSKPASPPHSGFTSRVLSRFHGSSGSHGNLFHVLSSSSKPLAAGTTAATAKLEDHECLQQSLRSLYEAEFTMLHTSTNVLSLLALRMSDEVAADIEMILRSARLCFTTLDGDFRADGYGATLEMVGNIVYSLPTLPDAHYYEAVVELLLIGLEYAKSKQLSYLAFRLLCHVIFKCEPADRIALASVALPRLQQCQLRLNSLLIEAAIDFLMSFAYSRSFSPPPALCNTGGNGDKGHASNKDSASSLIVQSRSWVYKNSILTIQVTKQGKAKLVIRRANCTNHWDLQMSRDFVLDPSAELPTFKAMADDDIDQEEGRVLMKVDAESGECENDLNTGNAQRSQSGEDTLSARLVNSMDLNVDECPTEPVDEKKCGLVVASLTENEIDGGEPDQDAGATTTNAKNETSLFERKSTITPVPATLSSLPPPSPVLRHLPSRKRRSARKQVTFALAGNSPTAFPHSSAALPPLPAYDGIGGSPSYFCEVDPVRRRNELRTMGSGGGVRNRPQAVDGSMSPFDGRSSSLYDEDDGPDNFSLDGSIPQPHQQQNHSGNTGRSRRTDGVSSRGTTTAATTAGSSTSEEPTTEASLDRRETTQGVMPPQDDESTHDQKQQQPQPIGTLDPMFLMMQLFDLTVANRPQLLANGAALSLGLNVLDRTPEYETHKVGLLYVRNPKQRVEVDILGNVGGSVRYLKFLRGLGSFTKLQGFPGYTGGLDTANNSDGKFGLIYKDNYTQVRTNL